ncbi:MAG: hypothetical protein ABII12_17040 [Planctomycetota bacterium]
MSKKSRVTSVDRRGTLLCSAGLALMVLLSGCGGGDTGLTIRRSASERPDLDQAKLAADGLSVPGDTPFNILSRKSGEEGQASGMTDPFGKDTAGCGAEASDGGSAWGAFQLGYCFDNATDTPLAGVVKLRLRASQSNEVRRIDGDKAATIGGTSSTNLQFFIKDTNGSVITREDLVMGDATKGPSSSSRAPELVFDVRLEPQRGYYLVLAGRTEVKAEAGESVKASLDVSEYSIEISWNAVPLPSSKDGGSAASAGPEAALPGAEDGELGAEDVASPGA